MLEIFIMPILLMVGLTFALDSWSPLGTNGEGESEEEPPEFGPGDDKYNGTDGDDLIYSLKGNDLITGGAGDDSIFLGDGFDRTADRTYENLETFDTELFEGNDTIHGGAKGDFVYDSMGENYLYGDAGDDIVIGVDDASDYGTVDQLFGGFGDDTLNGDDGDTMSGGEGTDAFQVSHRASADAVTVTDFETGETIEILDEDGDPIDAARISTQSVNGGLDTAVSVDGSVVATLTGVGTAPAGMIIN